MSPYEPRPEGLNTQPAPPSVVETLKPRTWHKGPPPHVGWWNASRNRMHFIWRWWDGEQWSIDVRDDYHAQGAAGYAVCRAPERFQQFIEWSDYWPENARVPRIDPSKENQHA